MRGWKMRDIENVGAAHGAVAIIVHRIQGVELDLHIEVRIRKRIRRKIDGRGELVKDGLEFRAGLNAHEFQAARARIRRIARRRCRSPGGNAEYRRGAKCRRQQGSPHRRGPCGPVNGSMRSNTSSRFQKWCLSAAPMCNTAIANSTPLKVSWVARSRLNAPSFLPMRFGQVNRPNQLTE